MVKGCSHGLMGESTLVNTFKIKSVAMVCFNGQMEEFTKGTGKMENNMEKELSNIQIKRN